MRFMALNGFRHSLRPYFDTDIVEIRDEFNWTARKALRLADEITRDRVPTAVIGFSDGATAAVRAAMNSPYVVRVYAHSPMYTDLQPDVRSFECLLFRTRGDRTPTFRLTGDLAASLIQKMHNPCQVSLTTLAAAEPLPVRGVATLIMRWKGHQFHNCLSSLPQFIINKTMQSGKTVNATV